MTHRIFNIRVIKKGDNYGLDDCKTHDEKDPLIEFFDPKYAGQKSFGPLGQFVSRYYAETLAEGSGGLCLDGGIPDWTVSAEQMAQVRELAKRLIEKGEK